MICISVVSHGHGRMTTNLIRQLMDCPEVAQILWTKNIPEPKLDDPGPRVAIIANPQPKGFGANHNAAFRACRQPYFCVLNPDIELTSNPFPPLLATLSQQDAALVAPQVVSQYGTTEDNMRLYPTVQSLVAKALRGEEGRAPLPQAGALSEPDWVAGMFMLLRSSDFAMIGGFDESYFLYYEDIELCAQLRAAGRKIIGDLSVNVTHRAQRASHVNLRHMIWHASSMMRFLWRRSRSARV